METKKNNIPVITEESLADARLAIKGGTENKSLDNVDLVEEILEKLKGKDMKAASEVLLTVALILDPIALHVHVEQLRELCAAKALHMLFGKDKEEKETNE